MECLPMKFLRVPGYFGLALLLSGGAASASETFVATIRLFPSPQEILNKLGSTTRWKAKGPATSTENLSSPPVGLSLSSPFLKECGFKSLWQENFTRGRQSVSVQIFELGDSSGAFSFYSIQNPPEGHLEEPGDLSISTPNDLWLWQANLVVHIVDPNHSGKLHPQLLEIGKELSKLIRQRAELPNIVKQLPLRNQIPASVRYALGPQGFENLKIPLQGSRLGLGMGAEISTAKYQFDDRTGQLLLINYPTPQMARKYTAGMQDPRSLLLNPGSSESVYFKRTGPIIAVLFGPLTEPEANKLLEVIHYTANLTWDEPPPGEEVAAYLQKVKQSIILTGVLLLITTGAGVIYGLIRVAVKRWVPIAIFDRPENVELTQLRLWEKSSPTPPPTRTPPP